jgi:septal ring factor EnvC (AmiA/AmiB activator)
MKRKLSMTILALSAMSPGIAAAQQHEIYFHQAGALLAYTDAEVRILFAAITAKEFDPDATKKTVEELDRALSASKNMVDRIQATLPESLASMEPDLVKFREQVKATEDQLRKLATDIEEQTGTKEGEEEQPELDEEGKPVGQRDWNLLKKGCGWLAADLAAARASYAKLAGKLKVKPIRPVPKPAGKRE